MDYRDVFFEARKRFNVVGVLGMSYSGVSIFMNDAYQRKFLIGKGMQDSDSDAATRMLLSGNKWLQLTLQQRNIMPIPQPDGTMKFDCPKTMQAIVDDRITYDKFLNQSWEAKMENQIRRIQFLCEKYPGLSKSTGVPLFIELPMSQSIANYNELVHELIVIKRPRVIDPDQWYYKHLYYGMGRFREVFTPSVTINWLESEDKYFDGLKYTANKVIENYASMEEFRVVVKEVLDSYVQSTILALQTQSPQKWIQE